MFSLLFFIILLLFLVPTFQSETSYLNLAGYSVSIALKPQTSIADFQTALEHCSNLSTCVGLYKQPNNNTYACIETLRNIYVNLTVPCNVVYIKDRRNDSVETGSASTTEKLLFFNYYNNGNCPSEATFQDPYCIYSTPQTFCTKFAPFFNATILNANTCRLLSRNYVEWP